MKAGWDFVPLGNVCTLYNGRAYNKQELLTEGLTPVLRVGNFFTNPNWYYSDLVLDPEKYCDNGDLLYAWSASFGPRIWDGGKVIYHYHIWKVQPDELRLDKRFLFYFLDWDKEQIKASQGAGTTMIHVTKGSMEARLIPLPPLEEQRRIVAVLDEAFAAIATATANAEKNLANAREILLDAIDRELTSSGPDWTETTMEAICSRFEYGTSAKSSPTGGVPVLRMGNLQNGEIDWSDLVFTDDLGDIAQLSLRPMDVLFNRTNSLEHVGKTAIVRSDTPAVFAGYLIRLHYRREAIDPEFLNLYLNSRGVRAYGRALAGKSVNQANISAGKLKTYPINLPPLSEQSRIVSLIAALRENLERLQDVQRVKIDKLAALRQSLLQRAFTGELTATVLKAAA